MLTSRLIDREARNLRGARGAKRQTSARSANARATPGWPASRLHTKTGMLFGQYFDGDPPRNLNHVFLSQFQNCSKKNIGTFIFKKQNGRAT